jgi:hypothetical protein
MEENNARVPATSEKLRPVERAVKRPFFFFFRAGNLAAESMSHLSLTVPNQLLHVPRSLLSDALECFATHVGVH